MKKTHEMLSAISAVLPGWKILVNPSFHPGGSAHLSAGELAC